MLEEGQLLHNHYQLKHRLGQNSGRQTWLAEDTRSSELVIVKLLAFNPQMQWDDLKLFEREASVLSHLSNSSIPNYRDYFSIDDHILWFGLVQDYIPGTSLKDLLKQGKRFSESEVKTIAANLLEILTYLHELCPAVLHRDIKPSNIILGEDGKVYLVDFGAVQARAAMEGATFTVVGTYGYTPIEQFGGRAVPASDLYALGATLIHILTGTAPADLPQQNMRIQFCGSLNLSTHFVNWLKRLLEPGVEQRFQTAREALTALKAPELSQINSLNWQKNHCSRIQLKKLPNQFGVKIPARGVRASDTLIIIWVLIVYAATIPFGLATFPFVVLFWLVGLMPLSMLIFFAFAKVNLLFNRSCFTLEWKLFGLRYRLLKGFTPTIQNIYANADNPPKLSGELLVTIAIQTKAQKYQFGGLIAPISVVERQWLIHEMKGWLGLPETADTKF